MRIGIDMSLTAEAKTGLQSYARSLVAALAEIDKSNQYLIYRYVWHSYPPEYEKAFCPRQGNFKVAREWMPKWLVDWLWKKPNVSKDWLIGGGDPDVYFSPFHSVPPRHFRRLVSVFHDVAFRVHPEFSTDVNRAYCEEQFDRAKRMADKMVTVSHFSKAEMVKHMGVEADWVRVTHEAADPMFVPVQGAVVPERMRGEVGGREFVLYVGSVEPRKNLPTLIKAFDGMLQRGRSKPLLVIAGGSGWKNSAVYEEIERRGLTENVYFTGFVTDEELLALYNTAAVFVYPSIYEGFGLPVVEAMSCGVPVVTTRVASIPEVGGEAVAYVEDPLDEDGLSRRLEEVLGDRELREDLSWKGFAQAGGFTWERTARETLAILAEVHGGEEYERRGLRVGRDERAIESGWHGMEVENGKPFRWTERRATLRMKPGGGEKRIVVEAATSVPEEEQHLAVRVNGRLVGSAPLRFGWREHSFALPAGVSRDQPFEVALDVSFELPPALKGSDTRRLGAKITRVEFA